MTGSVPHVVITRSAVTRVQVRTLRRHMPPLGSRWHQGLSSPWAKGRAMQEMADGADARMTGGRLKHKGDDEGQADLTAPASMKQSHGTLLVKSQYSGYLPPVNKLCWLSRCLLPAIHSVHLP